MIKWLPLLGIISMLNNAVYAALPPPVLMNSNPSATGAGYSSFQAPSYQNPGLPSTRITDNFTVTDPSQGFNVLQRVSPTEGPGVTMHPVRLIPNCWRQFETGLNNAITDVPGIQVGQVSVYGNLPTRIRTGVSAIVPNASLLTQGQGNLANTGFRAAGVILNGNGEVTGMGPLSTNGSGILNSPIVLTNTYSVGVADQGVFDYFDRHFTLGQWTGQLPVVGECWDGFFNTIEKRILTPQDTVMALENAKSGPVPQGRSGAGTGMRSFEMHSGTGSASRHVVIDGHIYTIGVLVNNNHSRMHNLNPMLRSALEQYFGLPLESIRDKDSLDKAVRPPLPSPRQGSIVTVIATDLPLDSQELRLVAERAGLGIANTGSDMSTSSGDFAVAFSTANLIHVGDKTASIISSPSSSFNTTSSLTSESTVLPDDLSPIFQATVEAVTEAQLNAITASHSNLQGR